MTIHRRACVHGGTAVLLGLLFAAFLALPGLDPQLSLVVSDLGQLAAVSGAAVLAWRAGGMPWAERRGWRLVAVGVGAWAVGQAIWSFDEIVLGREVPFPSLADLGFVLFPIVAGLGLLSWLASQRAGRVAARGRDVLDGLVVALSLLVVSWVTSLGAVVNDGGQGWLATTLSTFYPVADVIVGSLVLLAISRARPGERPVLTILGLGMFTLAFADSAYLYLVSVGSYGSANLVSSGWIVGFLLIGAAARFETSTPRSASVAASDDDVPSLLSETLPYAPFVPSLIAICWSLGTDPDSPAVRLVLGLLLASFVMGRQFFAMAENRRLYAALRDARDQLRQLTLTDALTGLPNRTLFTDRLDRAMRRPGRHVGLLFCDVDDFKLVNDTHGHDIGDLLLHDLAARLLTCVRAQDTVARLAGDEFAVLLEDAEHVAQRIVAATAEPFDLRGIVARVSMSVGAADAYTDGGVPTTGRRASDAEAPRVGAARRAAGLTPADLLLRDADQAMYAAKTAGKGRFTGRSPRFGEGVEIPVEPPERALPASYKIRTRA